MTTRSCLFAAALAGLVALSAAPLQSLAVSDTDAPHTERKTNQKRDPKRFRDFFRPFRTDRAAISPDGKHLAFTMREADKLFVVTCAIDDPGKAIAKVQVGDDEGASPMMARSQGEKTPLQIQWMRWVNSSRLVAETNQTTSVSTTDSATPSARLVVETNQSIPRGEDGGWSEWHGAILAFNVDGSDARSWILRDLVAPTDLTPAATEFSVRRSDLETKVKDRTWAADQPIAPEPDQIFQVPDNANSRVGLGGDEPPANRPATPGSIKIFSTDPSRPGAVTVMVTTQKGDSNAHWHQYLSLDVSTGKTVRLLEDIIPMNREAMIDRAGQLRLTLPNSLMRPLPHAYEYHGERGREPPVLLGDALARPAEYAVSAENYFGERTVPLAFDADPDVLYVASNVGRDTFGIYSLRLSTRQRSGFALENPTFDLIGPPTRGFPGSDVMVFDPHTHALAGVTYENAFRTTAWLRPEWQAMQGSLEQQFPGRIVEIEDWDAQGNRFVVLIHGPADAGALYVFDRGANRLTEFARRAPWMDTEHSHATLTVHFPNPDGTSINGLVTLPRNPRIQPAPLILFLSSAPWVRVQPDYQTEVQALADMGFIVAQLNGRGTWGYGRKQRDGIAKGYDQVQVEDILTAVQKLDARFNINRKRIALAGFEHGGFIALRAMQEYPDLFRCGVVVNAPIDLVGWLEELKWAGDSVLAQLTRGWFGTKERLAAQPLLSGPRVPKQPLLFLHYPGPDGGTRQRSYLDARAYAARLRQAGTDVEFQDLPADYVRGLPNARADAFALMEGFLNDHIYDFSVKLGELHEVKSP